MINASLTPIYLELWPLFLAIAATYGLYYSAPLVRSYKMLPNMLPERKERHVTYKI